ncbi:MAG: septal ring lytic transglycosylase RlpA family protein [Thermoanaerobaculia bacterium]
MIAARSIRRQPATWPLLTLAALWLAACATTRPKPPVPGEVVEMRGLASWYGDEFAGRPTANGEIFDPRQMTAAHRTLPFGTLVDVTYVRTGKTARVRVNDRGPFVGNRIIDLSYAAASDIGMVDDGIGEVDIAVVSVGGGDLEPPKPYTVTLPPPSPAQAAGEAGTPVAAAAPPPAPASRPVPVSPPPPEPVVLTEDLPTSPEQAPAPAPAAAQAAPPRAQAPAQGADSHAPAEQQDGGWVVQLGAFSIEANATELKSEVERITRPVSVQRSGGLYRVRVGPWAARSRAIEEKERLEAAGYKSIVVSID